MRKFTVLAVLVAGLSLACGGSSGTTPETSNTLPPIAPTGVVAGIVAGTSETPQINHTTLSVTGAAVTLDGQAVSTTKVQPGTVMAGQTTAGGMGAGASGGTYAMNRIQLRSSFMGPIQTLDQATSRLTIMNQVVQVNALTVLAQENQDGTSTTLTLTDFRVGGFVSVHGSFIANGSYLATRVERRTPGFDTSHQCTEGQVANLDTATKTFTLGTWTVSYGAATVSGTLANGAWTQVRGTISGNAIAATWVNVLGALGDPGCSMGLRGLALNLNTATKTFNLLNLTVSYTQATVVGTLAEGVMVEVQGALASGSTTSLVASHVEVETTAMGGGMGAGMGATNTQVKGTITAIDLSAMTFAVAGTNYWMDASTLILAQDVPVAASTLKVGDWVAVMADSTRTNSAGYAYATRIAEMAVISVGLGLTDVLGAVTSVNSSAQTLVLNGYTVVVSGTTTYLSQGSIITAATFWSTVKAGTMVEAHGTLTGATLSATRLVLGQSGSMGGGMGGGMH